MSFGPYATLDELGAFMRIPTPVDVTSEDGIVMSLALNAATDAINTATNRKFEVVTNDTQAEDRIYTAWAIPDDYELTSWAFFGPLLSPWRTKAPRVYVDDLTVTAGVTVKDANTGHDFTANISRFMPFNAPSKDRPFTAIMFKIGTLLPFNEDGLIVHAKWGWSGIPTTITNATLIQASRYVKRRDAPFGIAGATNLGNDLRLIAKVDPDVDVMLASYRRIWAAV